MVNKDLDSRFRGNNKKVEGMTKKERQLGQNRPFPFLKGETHQSIKLLPDCENGD
jgi:hypothetical protein